MLSKICYWFLSRRIAWGDKIEKPFDIWLYKHIN